MCAQCAGEQLCQRVEICNLAEDLIPGLSHRGYLRSDTCRPDDATEHGPRQHWFEQRIDDQYAQGVYHSRDERAYRLTGLLVLGRGGQVLAAELFQAGAASRGVRDQVGEVVERGIG